MSKSQDAAKDPKKTDKDLSDTQLDKAVGGTRPAVVGGPGTYPTHEPEQSEQGRQGPRQ
ncbi:hypothetical protein BH11PSE3_BH11PSE3_21970 [soil metagenome]